MDAYLISIFAPFSIYSFKGIQSIIFLLLFFVFLNSSRTHKTNTNKRIVVLFAGFTFIVYLINSIINFSIPNRGILFGLIFAALFLQYKRIYQLKIFELFLNAFCFLMVLSIIEYIVSQFFGIGFIIKDVARVETNFYNHTQYFHHYIFNLVKDDIFFRFQSVLEEPGNVGTICGLMIFLLKDKCYRKQLVICISAGILSLTMAFFVLFSFFLLSLISIKRGSTMIIACLLFVIVAFVFEEQINNEIVKRFENEKVDDRSNENFDSLLKRNILNNDMSLWLGHGSGATNNLGVGKGVVGAKRELYDLGILGVLSIFVISIISFFKYNKVSILSLSFFAAFWASWYQRSDIFSAINIILFFNVFNVYNRDLLINETIENKF